MMKFALLLLLAFISSVSSATGNVSTAPPAGIRDLTRFGCFVQRRTCCFKYTQCGPVVLTVPKLRPCKFNKCVSECTATPCTKTCKLVQATCETLETRRFVKFCLRKFCAPGSPGGGNKKWPREYAGSPGKLLKSAEGRRIVDH